VGTISATWSTSDTNLAILAGSIVGLIIWILISYFVGRAADRKDRSFTAFFLIAFLVSPIVGAVIVAALPSSPEMLIAQGRRKACPNCAEAIMPRAVERPHCGPPTALGRHQAGLA
jgi:MFS family permease